MKNLVTSTALALVLGLGAAPFTSPPALAQAAEVCSEFGLIDVDDDDLLSEQEYSAWDEGVFQDWDDDGDGSISEAEFAECYEAGGWYEVAEMDDDWEEDADELFAAWDDDEDDLLTETEFADEEEFAEWDADDDGIVDDQEFLIDDFLF